MFYKKLLFKTNWIEYFNSGKIVNSLLDNPCETLPISENWVADYTNNRCYKDYNYSLVLSHVNNLWSTYSLNTLDSKYIQNESIIKNVSNMTNRTNDFYRNCNNGHYGVVRKSDGYIFINREYCYGTYNIEWTSYKSFDDLKK